MRANVLPGLNRLQQGAFVRLRGVSLQPLHGSAVDESSGDPGSLVVGARGLNRPTYTETGASGRDATIETSETTEEARAKVRALYRGFLQHIPQMRLDFTLAEDWNTLKAVIRDQFERYRDVQDPHVIDILVFKGKQELNEIIAQWKSRHHVLQYVRQYEERMHQLGRYGPGHGSADTTGESPNVLDATRLRKVHEWRQKRIVPEWVVTWHHYEKWRDEQERLFRSFAIQNGLFTPEELDANRQYQERTDSHEMNSRQCRLM